MKISTAKEANTNLWIIFSLWPLGALITSIKYYRQNWAKNGLWLFIIFFGFTFIVQEGQDSSRYIEHLQAFHSSNTDFSVLADALYSEGSSYIDIFQPLVTMFVAQITGDPRLLMAVFALFFGFFYTRNIWYLVDRTEGKLNISLVTLIVVFALLVPFWFINGVRFWTAAHVFLYGGFLFFLDNKTRGLWVSLLSVFVHFSFIFPVLILFIYRIFGNKTLFYFIFFVVSSLFSEIDIPVVRDILLAYTPDIFHERITDYTGEAYIERLSETRTHLNWYIVWYGRLLNILIKVLLISIFFIGKEVWQKRKEMLCLFSFLLLFNGFANVFSQIPSVGRFLTVGGLFSTAFLFLYTYYNNSERLSKRLLIFFSPVLLLFFIVSMRIGFDNIGIYALIANPLIAPFLTNEIALIDLIK